MSQWPGGRWSFPIPQRGMLKAMKQPQPLQEALVRNEAILSSIGDGLIVVDEYGKIARVNQQALILLATTEKNLVGRPYMTTVRALDDQGNEILPNKRPMSDALATGQRVAASFNFARMDGAVFPVAITVTPIILDSRPIGAIAIFRDITQEKELEKMKDEFVSIASHELRTPMTAIKGLISMVMAGDYGAVNEGLKEPLTDIAQSTDRLIRLVNDMLNLSRIVAGRLIIELTEFDLSQLVAETIDSLQPIAKANHINLSHTLTKPLLVQADRDEVRQILNNLLGNALKFTNRGSVTVSAKATGELAQLRVADTGVGISQANQVKLFGKFVQLSARGQSWPAGTGLGLHISRELARKMGGDVWLVTSQLGKGSTFTLSLPLAGSSLATKIKRQVDRESRRGTEQKPLAS